eukprot:scaffold25532_cov68-Cyclotella_meneghiniana.AAC.2
MEKDNTQEESSNKKIKAREADQRLPQSAYSISMSPALSSNYYHHNTSISSQQKILPLYSKAE